MTTSRSTRRHETASQALLRLDPGNLRRPSETAMALNPPIVCATPGQVISLARSVPESLRQKPMP